MPDRPPQSPVSQVTLWGFTNWSHVFDSSLEFHSRLEASRQRISNEHQARLMRVSSNCIQRFTFQDSFSIVEPQNSCRRFTDFSKRMDEVPLQSKMIAPVVCSRIEESNKLSPVSLETDAISLPLKRLQKAHAKAKLSESVQPECFRLMI